MVVNQSEIWLVNLDPTIGSEIKTTRPCVIISPDSMNKHLRTVQIAPMTSNTTDYPWRVQIVFEKRHGRVAIDQIRTIDRRRLIRKLGKTTHNIQQEIKSIIHEMLVL